MTREEFSKWLEKRVTTQNRLVLAAAFLMVFFALVANYLEYRVLKFMVSYYVGWLGEWIYVPAALMIMVLITAVTWMRMRAALADDVHTSMVNEFELPVHIAPTMGAVWTYALGSLESDRTWIERIVGMGALPQRLICGAVYLFQRVQQFGSLDVDACGSIIRLLYKHHERVDITTIARKFSDLNLTDVLRDLSLIDGITFLTRQNVGVSLAPRLTEELNGLTELPTTTSF
jgi:hypothetical protein